MIFEALFWISAFLVFYVYVGYPLLAWLLARLIGRPVRKAPILPRVTVLTAAYNEATCIEATVRNKLAQDYPAELLDVIVISDGSTDGTDEIVESLGPRVRLFRQSPRAGKTAALNLAVDHAVGEVLVFSDANSIYAPDAIRRLVENFADPEVGYVTGKMVYVTQDGSMVGDGCSAYMKYENWLRVQETMLASVIGVDGGIDAVRKFLFVKMRPDQLPDFVLPLSVVGAGHRVVYEPRALLKEAALNEHGAEYRMRVRVGLRALWAMSDLRRLLNPLRSGMLAFQLISHKLLRYLAFMPLLGAVAASLFLATESKFYATAAVVQGLLYFLALAGWLRQGHPHSAMLSMPYYFLLLNIASAHSALRFVRGEKQSVWVPRSG